MNVELPFLAEGIEGGDVVQLLVREGDRVSEGQSLIELETDKATVPVPTPVAGTVVRLLVQPGDHVKVGQALIELDGSDGEAKRQRPRHPKSRRRHPSPNRRLPRKQTGRRPGSLRTRDRINQRPRCPNRRSPSWKRRLLRFTRRLPEPLSQLLHRFGGSREN